MSASARKTSLSIAIAAALSAAGNSGAVRINADGHGQALIYPYYTARSTTSGNAYVSALSIVNVRTSAKAVKVRFLEGKVGAEVLDFNLYLSAYDVWTAGIVAAGAGAGLFTLDNSCTTPKVSNSASSPTLFRNGAYAGVDGLGDTLDRTYEGYFEVLEMGTIRSGSSLEAAVTPKQDLSAPNASRPSCANLPATAAAPTSLIAPTGGLIGGISYINVNEGTDYAVNAIALSQWTDRVQWSVPGAATPNLASASPAISTILDNESETDRLIMTRWPSGRDAVTALLMVDHVMNDYSVEPAIKAATDIVITMPTKRFYVDAVHAESPFALRSGPVAPPGAFHCELVSALDAPFRYYDRESLAPVVFYVTIPQMPLCGAVAVGHVGNGSGNGVFPSSTGMTLPLEAAWISGWLDIQTKESSQLIAPAGMTTITDLSTGVVANASVTYYGLPMTGFAAQSYSTRGLPGVNPNVLSNYGGNFAHKVRRRIETSR